MAFSRSACPTMLGMTACMDGPKRAFADPATMEITTTCQIVMCPVAVKVARARAAAEDTLRVESMMARRLARSAIAPPRRPSSSTGMLPAKLIVPRRDALRVMS